MKKLLAAIALVLVCTLPLGLAACQREKSPAPSTDSVTEPSQSPAQPSDHSEPTPSSDAEVRREPADISLYPFTEEELGDAQEAVREHLDEVSKEAGVVTYEVECIAYDPIMTDVHVRQTIAGAPVDGWTEEDYYQRQMSFSVTYSAAYDHEKSPMQDADHQLICVSLRRENAQSPWEFQDSGVPVEEYSDRAMSAEELAAVTDAGGRVLAGYEAGDDTYWLYLCDDTTGTIRYFKRIPDARPEPTATEPFAYAAVWDESDYQAGAPVTPQPGDTQDTWNPALAAEYPSDGDCSDMELLEKWMAVEGLTMEDLDERNCEQLVLVVARETDGVQTDTVCYEKQSDGSWASVDGLTRMQGFVGSNGIMHGRKRNSDTSPAGLWSLGLAFGNSAKPEGLRMPWRNVTPNTDWVCDEDSIYFNSWQERDDPALLGTWSDDVEHLEDYVEAYAYACVIRFNTPPYTVPERGCAIFLHCSKRATGGCIGLPEADLVDTLLWLNPERNPYILISGYQKEEP